MNDVLMADTPPSSNPKQASTGEPDNCAREPIHQIQLVQPHGFLIACDARSGLIRFNSCNVADFLQTQIDLIGLPVSDLLEGPAEANLAQLAAVAVGTPMVIDLRFRSGLMSTEHFEVVAHRVDGDIVIEALPFPEGGHVSSHERRQVDEMVRGIGELHRVKSMAGFLDACVSQIRHLSGYQRVFIYRFRADWSGEVIAESTADGCASRFVGLRFPASDIPEQARALYRTNLLRIIGDVDATPVALLSGTPGQLLDQSHSLLRSPSSMHLRYLQNMGVRATMTISLLKDGELWGMVSCHHDAPRVPPVELRRMTKLLCALLAEVAVVRLDAVLHEEIIDKTLRFRTALNQLVRDVGSGMSFPLVVEQALADVSSVLKIGSCGLVLSGRWICSPAASPGLLAFLLGRGRELDVHALFTSACLVEEADLAPAELAPWAGAMVLRIPGTADSFLVMLRNEVIQEVHWAGAPSKQRIEMADGLQVLGPRQSFDTWTEVMQGQSEPWTAEERLVVTDVARTLGEAHQIHVRQVMQAELRMLGSCMEHLNDMVIVTDTLSIAEPGPTIIYVNESFVATTGFSREEVIGRSPRMLQGPATDRAQLDVIRAAMQSWSPVAVELINYKKSGEPFWVEISLAPIADSNGWYTHWVAIERDISDRKRSEEAMQQLVNFDTLTALPNRRLLMDRLPIALSTSKRYNRNGALLFVDLDNFKDLNDTEGHHVGDQLLKQVAQRLVSIVRIEDTVARLGGDEFVVMLENLSVDPVPAAAAAQQFAEKIVTQLARPYDLSGQSYSSTASLGISMFHDSERQRSVEELLKQADFAMYQSKAAGRNTWRFFDPKTQAVLVERNALEADLKQAFACNHLCLHYQPIVDADRKIVGVEALMRWQHATRGWVSPMEFIPIAENSGLIVQIGNWAIGQACSLLRTWSADSQRTAWSIAVNVSARQIRQTDFVAIVEGMIRHHRCNPALLKLELTESLLQHDVDVTIAKMDALRAIGVTFSIDDFGTGYSSLAYLKRLPISVLKIDRSFVRDIGVDHNDMSICMMILALGKTLELSIVAEGVETAEQYAFLKLHHCEHFQGFLFSKAVPAEMLGAVAASLLQDVSPAATQHAEKLSAT